MVSEALIYGKEFVQVSDTLVAAPAIWPVILNLMFSSKRVSHRGTDEVSVFVGLCPLYRVC